MIFTTQKELDASLKEWQERLRLQDWHVCAKIVRRSGMEDANTQAHINMIMDRREAQITLLDPLDYPDEGEVQWPQDHERSLVHELIHIHLEAIIGELTGETQDRLHTQCEQLITSLDWALVNLDRRK